MPTAVNAMARTVGFLLKERAFLRVSPVTVREAYE